MKQETVIRRVSTDGFETDVLLFGSGKRALVILPGLSLKSVMLSASDVAAAYSRFTADHTVYLFDRRYDLPDGYTVKDMARDAAAVMRKLGLSSADVFGVSQGGMIAQSLAIDCPELVHKLVLASTACYLTRTAVAAVGGWVRLAREKKTEELCLDFAEKLYTPDAFEKSRAFFSQMANTVTPEELTRFITLAEGCFGFSTADELTKIQCPTLVLGARHDRVLGSRASVTIAKALGCECYLYGAPYGHGVYDEAPDFKDRIERFLQK